MIAQNLSTKIDRWVILEAMKHVAAQHQTGKTNIHAIINLSKETMADQTLMPWRKVAFKAAQIPAHAIIFQVKEADVNDQLNVAKTFYEGIKDLQAGTSITRFGCALNPLNALKTVDTDYVKIDGSFTDELQNGDSDSNSLNELIGEIHELDKVSIEPFVENASILSKLWQSGVHYIQGHYLQPPGDDMDYDFDMES